MFNIFQELFLVKEFEELEEIDSYYDIYYKAITTIKKMGITKKEINNLEAYEKYLLYFYEINLDKEDKLKNEIFIFDLFYNINEKLGQNNLKIINDIFFDEWNEFINSTNENRFKNFLKLKKKSSKSYLLTILIGKTIFQDLYVDPEKFIFIIYFILLEEFSLKNLNDDLSLFETIFEHEVDYKHLKNILSSLKIDETAIGHLIRKKFKGLKSVLIDQYLKNEKRSFFVQIFLYCLKQIKTDKEKVKEIFSFCKQTGILLSYTGYSLMQTHLLQRMNEFIKLLQKINRDEYTKALNLYERKQTIHTKELKEDILQKNFESIFKDLENELKELFEKKHTRNEFNYTMNSTSKNLNDKFKTLIEKILDLKIHEELIDFKKNKLIDISETIEISTPTRPDPIVIKSFLDEFKLRDFETIFDFVSKDIYPEEKFQSIKDDILKPYVIKILSDIDYTIDMRKYYIEKKFQNQWISHYQYILNMFKSGTIKTYENLRYEKEIIDEDIKNYDFLVKKSQNNPIFEEYKINEVIIEKKILSDKKKFDLSCDKDLFKEIEIPFGEELDFGYIHFFFENKLLVDKLIKSLMKCLHYKILDETLGGYKEIRLNYETLKSIIGLLKNFPTLKKDELINILVKNPYRRKIIDPDGINHNFIVEDNIPFMLKYLKFEDDNPFWLWFLKNENSEKFNNNIVIILKDKPILDIKVIKELLEILKKKFEFTKDEKFKEAIVELVKMYKINISPLGFFKINMYNKFIKKIWEEEEGVEEKEVIIKLTEEEQQKISEKKKKISEKKDLSFDDIESLFKRFNKEELKNLDIEFKRLIKKVTDSERITLDLENIDRIIGIIIIEGKIQKKFIPFAKKFFEDLIKEIIEEEEEEEEEEEGEEEEEEGEGEIILD